MQNSNRFQKGNDYRFSGDNQPQRQLTTKQLIKRLENMICADRETLESIANASNLPHVIVDGAANVLAGNPIKVVELINSLRLCQESTQIRSTRQKN